MMFSELLKWKGFSGGYLLFGWSALKIATIPLYLAFVTNPLILEGVIELSMLGDCLLLTIVTILMAEQEKRANHFQQVLGECHPAGIWLWKLLVLALLLVCSSLILWTSVGLVRNSLSQFLQIALVVLSLEIWLSHAHLFFALFLSRTVNLLLAFLDCLVLVFASNHVFEGWYCFPTALPINAMFGDSLALHWSLAWSGLALLTQLGYVAWKGR